MARRPHRVVVLALAPVVGYDMAIPPLFFGEAKDEAGHPLYEVSVAGLGGTPVASTAGYAITPNADESALATADTVVVHPPFRWQRRYGAGFVDGIERLNREFAGVTFAVENMYLWRNVARPFKAYLPDYDPTDLPYDHLVLDCSHASTARQSSRELARRWGSRLHHLHLTDGSGSIKDDHLFPGEGDQEAFDLLDDLRVRGFTGDVVEHV